jgi:formate hydrogenlyase subunit 3/multisubunit Na+/H+ antiporter MnhD subunit
MEISSLASYALIALGRWRQALLAAFQCLVLGTVRRTFLLIGIGLALDQSGSIITIPPSGLDWPLAVQKHPVPVFCQGIFAKLEEQQYVGYAPRTFFGA